MKSLLLVACLGALLAGTTALPVIRGFVGIQHSPVQFNYQIPLSMAVNLCGLNARCLLNQNIIGMNHPEVRQEYDTLVRLAVLRELMGMSNHRPQDSSSEEVPEEPIHDPPEVPDVVDVTHDEVPDTSDSDEEIGFHRVGMIAIGNGLGTRRIIIIGNTVVKDETTDEDIDTAAGTDDSDDVSPTPKVEVAPTSRPTPAVPRIYTTPSPVPEVTTDLTNSIEQNGRGSTTPSSDEGRESLGDSVENTDQVEVFDPARPERRDPEKPQRFADWEKFKYITPRTPQVRQMRWQAQDN